MFPMLIRTVQAVLVFFGAVLLVAALQATFTPSHPHSIFLHVNALFAAILDFALAFACFLGAYRIGKWQKKPKQNTRVPPTYRH